MCGPVTQLCPRDTVVDEHRDAHHQHDGLGAVGPDIAAVAPRYGGFPPRALAKLDIHGVIGDYAALAPA